METWYWITDVPTTNPLYTTYNMGDKGVRIGLPGVSRGEVALKDKDGFFEVYVAEKLVYKIKIPERTAEVKCSMKEGLLDISWVGPPSPKIVFSD